MDQSLPNKKPIGNNEIDENKWKLTLIPDLYIMSDTNFLVEISGKPFPILNYFKLKILFHIPVIIKQGILL